MSSAIEQRYLTEFASADSGMADNESLQRYSVTFDRSQVLPPDSVTVSSGLQVGWNVRCQMAAEQLYHPELERERPRRILDVGCGAASFLVAAIAGSVEWRLPEVELVGFDRDEQALEFGQENLSRAVALARQQAPEMRLSYDLQPTDWNNPAAWSGLGDFDWIYFNPPYLIPGQKTRSGYEQVPASHMYIDDPRQTYVQVVQQCLPRLAYGASMMCRLPVDDGPLRFDFFDREHQKQMTVGAPAGLISIQSLTPVAGDRSRKAIVYTAAENALPPYGDPRAMILAKHGYDFHALMP